MTFPSAMRKGALSFAIFGMALSSAADAQSEGGDKEPLRTRVALGPQLKPSFPGSDSYVVRPLIDLSRARGDGQFRFEAPDESFGFALMRTNGFSFGTSLGYEGSRTVENVGAALPRVGSTIEAGGFVQYEFTEALRLRTEVRKGLGGHKGIIATVSGDYVIRDGDRQLISIGPRVTLSDNRYQDAFFSVADVDSGLSGLAAYNAGGGVQAVGATAAFIQQLTPKWGIYSYARYDRLVGDAANSPIVRTLGSRDQFSGGIALSYTFGGNSGR